MVTFGVPFICIRTCARRFGFVLLAALTCIIGRAEENRAVSYALVRDRVVQVCPQQAEEMSNALSVLRQLTEQTAAVLSQIEEKCSKEEWSWLMLVQEGCP